MLGRLKGVVKKALGREAESHASAPPARFVPPAPPDAAAPPIAFAPAVAVAPSIALATPVAAPPPVETQVEPSPVRVTPPQDSVAIAAAKAHAEAAQTTEDVHAGEPPKIQSMAQRAMSIAQGHVASTIVHADMGSTDLEHYRARAIANGRDPGSITGGEGENQAEDGATYWGPVDNESSRAKSGGRVLTVDQWECISCGTCVEQTDKVFFLPPDGKATPIAQDGPMDLIQDAIEACPVTCIHWVTPSEAKEKGLATGIDSAGE